MCPDFQRGHVWTEDQQTRFVEFVLKGGDAGVILLNHPGWQTDYKGDFTLVDGLQRLTALRRFLRGEIRAYGLFVHEFEGALPSNLSVKVEIHTIKERKALLQWYVGLNEGGTVHSQEEILRVKELITQE